MKRFQLLIIFFQLLCGSALGQVFQQPLLTPTVQTKRGNYELPLRFAPDRLTQFVYSTQVEPHYLANGKEFWYSYKSSKGVNWYYVDMRKGVKESLFDPQDVAAQLGVQFRRAIDPLNMDIEQIGFSRVGDIFTFLATPYKELINTTLNQMQEQNERYGVDSTVYGIAKRAFESREKSYFAYDRKTAKIKWLTSHRPENLTPEWASISPNGKWVVFCRNNNIKCMSYASFVKWCKSSNSIEVDEFSLTTDGSDTNSWSSRVCGQCGRSRKCEGWKRTAIKVWWSPDSKYFATAKALPSPQQQVCKGCSFVVAQDERSEPNYNILDDTTSNFYKSELYLFDMEKRAGRKIDVERFENQQFGLFQELNDINFDKSLTLQSSVWVGDGSKNFYIYRTSADRKSVDICRVDFSASSPTVTTIIEDRLTRAMELRPLFLTPTKKELLFWSQRTGLGHLYLYDLESKKVRELTSGGWECKQLLGFASSRNSFYYVANGCSRDENPYYSHLYSIDISTKKSVQLTQSDYNHSIIFDGANRVFIDNYSRVDSPPSSQLCNLSGKVVTALEVADLSKVKESGFTFPERFTVKASDGITNLYGVIYKPINFDSTATYPVVQYIYPTASSEQRGSQFSTNHQQMFRLAQFGFVVVAVGSRAGEPNYMNLYREGSSSFNGYRASVADKSGAMHQLANRYRYFDRANMAIVGYDKSAILASISQLAYPDIYKAAVVVTSQGVKDSSAKVEQDRGYMEIVQDGYTYAPKLKGDVLIVAQPDSLNLYNSTMINLSHHFVKSGKRFDMIPIYNSGQKNEREQNDEYIFWRIGDFLCEKLLNHTHSSVDIPR